MRIAEPRIAATTTKVELAGLTGEKLDLPSEEFDAALSTWTLCTIPDVGAALEEIRRVLQPGGTFHFVEHGRAPDVSVARWQARIEPPWKHLAGGCHVTREISELVERAGFRIDKIETYYISLRLHLRRRCNKVLASLDFVRCPALVDNGRECHE